MASLLIKLDKRRKLDKRGKDTENIYPAKLVIFNNQTSAYISLGISLPEKAWIKDGVERPVVTTHSSARTINDDIQALYIRIRKIISDLELSGQSKSMKAAEVKKHILSVMADTPRAEVSFSSFANQHADGCKSAGTKRNYLFTINKLIEFAKKDIILFEEITHIFLREFDEFLSKSGSGVNTRSIHFRNIRTVFNRAIDDDIIPQDLYPFRKFKIKSEEKDKVSLSAEQVKNLHNYNFEKKSLNMARDFWMLSFFLCGINPVDLYHLKKPDKNNIVSFVRQKEAGASHYTIRLSIQPEAQIIVDKYKAAEDSEYLLNLESKYTTYEVFRSFVSKKIREIAEITGLTGLTLYWARYSWATIADGLDIPEKTISKGLGHVDKSMAGRSYIAFDWSKVDRANREVIDHIFSIEQTTSENEQSSIKGAQ